jgi:hypothetical protein
MYQPPLAFALGAPAAVVNAIVLLIKPRSNH